jgi:uncharacterized protein
MMGRRVPRNRGAELFTRPSVVHTRGPNMRIRSWIGGAIATVVLGCGASLSPADTAEEASRSYDQRDFERAADLYQDACDDGEASACTRLGLMYGLGEGVARSPKKAADLYRKACDGNDARGCGSLGQVTLDGNGVAKNERRADELFDKACRAGHPAACAEHGVSLWRGRGALRDAARAKGLLERSCGAGFGRGCFYLGVLLRMGEEGVPADPRGAEHALRKACQLEEREACGYLEKHRAALQQEESGGSKQ